MQASRIWDGGEKDGWWNRNTWAVALVHGIDLYSIPPKVSMASSPSRLFVLRAQRRLEGLGFCQEFRDGLAKRIQTERLEEH